ncbi:hypothetical protein D5086_023520 [Populus alba]|uniref:Uncharacterized protein n=1 Tax=Populus alba TaxID=43335 RepID=A0ACC4BAI2_POPAL
MYAYLANSPEHDQYDGVQAMQASKRIAEEAPSSSRSELLLLNLQRKLGGAHCDSGPDTSKKRGEGAVHGERASMVVL